MIGCKTVASTVEYSIVQNLPEGYMVMMIGIVTMTALVWVLASSMARESEAERRRVSMPFGSGLSPTLTDVHETVKEAA
jgi:hypothetical protein